MFYGLILVVNHIADFLLGCNAMHFKKRDIFSLHDLFGGQKSSKVREIQSNSFLLHRGATHPGQDYFFLRVLDLNQHAHPRGRGEVILNRIVIDLYPVNAWNRGAFLLELLSAL